MDLELSNAYIKLIKSSIKIDQNVQKMNVNWILTGLKFGLKRAKNEQK